MQIVPEIVILKACIIGEKAGHIHLTFFESHRDLMNFHAEQGEQKQARIFSRKQNLQPIPTI